jgi:protein-disulfide isomerase
MPSNAIRIVALTLALLVAPSWGWSQSPAASQTDRQLREEIEALKRGQEQIRADLAEIKRLLGARQGPAPAGADVEGKVFDLGDNPVKGDPAARLTLVEFTDYQCPYCSRHVTATYPQIAATYVDTGKLRYASLDLPLESIHPLAFKAAEAAHCAGDQDRFWEMHERLFANQRQLEPWAGHAEALGLDVGRFTDCLEQGSHAQSVRADMGEAAKAGASATPSFVLARTDPDDERRVTGIVFIRGAQSFSAFQSQIEAALAALEGP